MPSVIKKYEMFNDDIIEVGAFIIERAGLEGIYIDSLGNLSCIFENFDGIDNLNITYNVKINSLDFSKKLTELDNDLESYYKKQGQANKDRLNRR